MRILMALWAGGGTVPVELGVARRLVGAGHEVTVLAEPAMEAGVLAAEARFRSWESAPRCVELDIADWECGNPVSLLRRLLDRLFTGPAAAYATDVRAAAEEEAYDAAVVDFALLGALAATESLDLPTAVTMPNLYVRPTAGEPPFGVGLLPGRHPLARLRDQVLPRVAERVWDVGLRDLNDARRGLGLDPLRHVWAQLDRAERVLVLTAESFERPPGRRPANVTGVGPVLDDPHWAEAGFELPPGDDPLVLVGTSGSRIRGGPEALARVVEALADLRVRAVVGTGPAIAPPPTPRPGIHIVRSVPHSRVLPYADMVVTHGGHGSVIKALAAGRPCLVLPLGRDQPDNAARVVAHHAGLRLPPTASPDRIARAVEQILGDPSFAAGAARLGARIRAETDDARIVAAVEAVTAGHRS